jgi:hypothetical protein
VYQSRRMPLTLLASAAAALGVAARLANAMCTFHAAGRSRSSDRGSYEPI